MGSSQEVGLGKKTRWKCGQVLLEFLFDFKLLAMLWGKLFPVFHIFSHSQLYMESCVGGILGNEELGGGGVAEKYQF